MSEAISRKIPNQLKREVRKKSYYGCVHCGNPLIQYHHVIPFSEVHEHKLENLTCLCPTCHMNFHNGVMSKRELYNDIQTPCNKDKSVLSESFSLGNPSQSYMILGTNKFINTSTILRVNGKNVIWYNLDEQGNLLLNVIFFNNKGDIVGIIEDNCWSTPINENIWDIDYSAGILKVKSTSNSIDFKFGIKDDVILIDCNMMINGRLFKANKNEINMQNTCFIKNSIIDSCGCAINIE